MDATLLIVPARLVYMNIPANELRMFVDGFFPVLAKNPIADRVTGYGHRYVAGHDLFVDIPRTFLTHGPMHGLKHAGHVLATDFPTKAGIPIPGFSHSGFGSLLEQAGIHKGWLNLNLCDAGAGVFSWAEGSADLAQALSGTLKMDWGTFFDTFAEGGLEVGVGITTQNPALVLGGIENVLAGVVATWNRLSIYVDPLEFFGAAGTSALIGFVLAYGLAGETLSEAVLDGIRSGTVGALYTLSPAFGYGALSGLAAYRLGSGLAKKHNESMHKCFSLNEEAYRLLVEEICNGNVPVRALVESASPRLKLLETPPTLSQLPLTFRVDPKMLSENSLILGSNSKMLQDNPAIMASVINRLPDDPPLLADWYRLSFAELAA